MRSSHWSYGVLFGLVCVLFLNGCPPGPLNVNVIRVARYTPAAQGDQDGLTWATAFNEIQEGIDAAADLGGGEVWVEDALYDEIRSDDGGDVDGSLILKANVHVYGGFWGDETLREQRDWESNTTTISGAHGRGLDSAAYHVVKGADDATLDGFTITEGNAKGASEEQKYGGGMYNNFSSPVLSH